MENLLEGQVVSIVLANGIVLRAELANVRIGQITELRFLVENAEIARGEKVLVCNAPWGCSRPSSKQSHGFSRKIGGKELCHACCVRIYEHAKKHNLTHEQAMEQLPAPTIKVLDRTVQICERIGCGNELGKQRRSIGDSQVCHSCYQTVCGRAKRMGVTKLEAFNQLPMKVQRL